MFSSAAYAMAPSGGEGQGGGGALGVFFPMILIFGIFYFLLLRPQQKKQKTHRTMVQQLKKGDRVVSSGGIHGTIVGVKENVIVLRIADNVKIEINRSAISGVLDRGASSGESSKDS